MSCSTSWTVLMPLKAGPALRQPRDRGGLVRTPRDQPQLRSVLVQKATMPGNRRPRRFGTTKSLSLSTVCDWHSAMPVPTQQRTSALVRAQAPGNAKDRCPLDVGQRVAHGALVSLSSGFMVLWCLVEASYYTNWYPGTGYKDNIIFA